MLFPPLRPVFISLHRWLGVLLAPVFVLILLSGALLSLRPIVGGAPDGGTTGEVDAAALRLLVTKLEGQAALEGLTVVEGGRALEVRSPNAAVAGRWTIATGMRTSAPAAGETGFFAFVVRFHKTLLLGLGGLVELASWAMLAILVSGPFLAWLHFRNTIPGWHTALGWCLLPLILLPPLTGLMMIYGVGRAHGPTPVVARPVKLSEALAVAAPRLDLSGLIDARRARDGTVVLRTQGEGKDDDAVRGLRVSAHGAAAFPDQGDLIAQIHAGTWRGAWSGGLNLALSLALMALTVTGFWSWFGRVQRDRHPIDVAGADILVAHASQTGTGARIAGLVAEALRGGGETVALAPLGTLAPHELKRYRHVLLVAATTGKGDMPDTALRFAKELRPGALAGVRIAILALGDSRFGQFCGGAEKLRSALRSAGAEETLAMARADVNPFPALEVWLTELHAVLGLRSVSAGLAPLEAMETLVLAERRRLDDPDAGDTLETWAVVLESTHPLAFRPGDLLRVAPAQDAEERAYSIGSSSQIDPRRIVLTVRLHRWLDGAGLERFGVMSHLLTHGAALGTRFAARLDSHPTFNPPDDPGVAIIMICVGTGIAPFPGFLTERQVAGCGGPTWLVFGNRHRAGDFLWGAMFESAFADGTLARLDTAFSRDSNDGHHIQARLKEQAAEVRRWLIEKQALVYICGRRQMARGVENTLAEILAEEDGLSLEAARAQIEDWVGSQRIRVDAFE